MSALEALNVGDGHPGAARVYEMLGQGNVDVFNYMNDKQWHLGSSSSAQPKILRSCKKIMTMNTFIIGRMSDITNHRGCYQMCIRTLSVLKLFFLLKSIC